MVVQSPLESIFVGHGVSLRIYHRLNYLYREYPRQFWLMFVGMLISTVGSSMIWPFLMIFLSENLDVPLTVAASLLTLNSMAGLIASVLAGPVVDRLGRKWIMVYSLLLNGVSYFFLGSAANISIFVILMTLNGIAQPLYQIGGDAMLADMLPPEKRIDGYALLRLSNNVGVAIGPAIGGFLAATSYSLAFSGAAIGMGIYAFLLAIFAIETLPKLEASQQKTKNTPKDFGGYLTILRDRPFMSFSIAYTMVIIIASLVWVLLPVYAKQNFQIPESQYGWIATTNALMVVFFQVIFTRKTKHYQVIPVMSIGALFYGLAVLSIASGTGFWSFWISMVIMTIGELILVPTASTYAANLAPADMRGRYMSIFGLSWRLALGIGPILGGFLNDNLGPKAIWYGGAILGLASTLFFSQLQNGKFKHSFRNFPNSDG